MVESRTFKGISPLIAAVLLIAFTISVSLLAGPFFTDILQKSQEDTGDDVNRLGDAAEAHIEVTDAEYDNNSGTVSGALKNSGQTELENFTVTIYGEDLEQGQITDKLAPGEVVEFNVTDVNADPESIRVESNSLPVRFEDDFEEDEDDSGSTVLVTGTVSASPGWEDVRVEIIESGTVMASDLTNGTGDYEIELDSSGTYTISAAGVKAQDVSLEDGTNVSYDLNGEVKKDGSTVKSFNSVSASCNINGTAQSTVYPEIDGVNKVSVPEQLQCMKQDMSENYTLTQEIYASDTEKWNPRKEFTEQEWPSSGTRYQTSYYPVKDGSFEVVNQTDGTNVDFEVINYDNGTIEFKENAWNHGVNISYELEGEIYEGFRPIGDDKDGSRFNATLDGDGHGIDGLHINRANERYVGLFGSTNNSNIQSISLTNVNVTADGGVGGLIGRNYNSNITDSHVDGKVEGADDVGGMVGRNEGIMTLDNLSSAVDVKGTDMRAGGLVGVNTDLGGNGTIKDSYATGKVKGSSYAGGLVGASEGTIKGSYATGNVQGIGDNPDVHGGLVGENAYGGRIFDSYAEGNVTSEGDAGGLAGWHNGEIIRDSYATGDISSDDEVGGLIGRQSEKVRDSYATGDVSGNLNVGGVVGDNQEPLKNVYAMGNVDGGDNVGGIAGKSRLTSINRTLYVGGKVSGNNSVGGLVGRIGLNKSYADEDHKIFDSYSIVQADLNESDKVIGRIVEGQGGGNVVVESGSTTVTADGSSSTDDIKQDLIDNFVRNNSEMTGSNAKSNMSAFSFQKKWDEVKEGDSDAESDGYPILESLDREKQLKAQDILAN